MAQEQEKLDWRLKQEKISFEIVKLLNGLNNYQAKKIIELSLSVIDSVSIINSKHL